MNFVTCRETTHGIDNINALDEALANAYVPLIKLVSFPTDDAGASAMVGKHDGSTELMKSDLKFPKFFLLHSIIYCKYLVAKYLKYEDVVETH